MWVDNKPLSDLVGKTLSKVERLGDELRFHVEGGPTYCMLHEQDCCEGVSIEDIVGNLDDLVGTPIVIAEEVDSKDTPPKNKSDAEYGDFQWTFYRFRTIKGDVDIRWYGTSNGYYSTSVSFGVEE